MSRSTETLAKRGDRLRSTATSNKPGIPRAAAPLAPTFILLLAMAFGLVVLACSGAPKPCPVASEANYTAALVAACKDVGSVEKCPAAAAIKAEHEAEQEDAGCRVK